MTLSFIPKLLVMFIVLVVGGPWMLNLLMDYTRRLFTSIPGLVG
jgi:flagellar biosynthetic protein FliQ